MSTEDPLELISCPFDPVHMVQRKRMQIHIVKCSKNVDMRKFRTCPFNAQHVVPLEEYQNHVKTCEGRAVIDKEIMFQQKANNPDIAAGHLYVPPSNFVVPESTECWDNDDYTVVVGYSAPAPQPAPQRERPRADPNPPRLPRKGTGESERTMVYDYSAVSKPVGASASPQYMAKPRGRGRGLAGIRGSDFQGRSVGGVRGNGFKLPPVESASELDTTATETATESEATPLTPEETRTRDIRKLKKMLRQIEKIEVKRSNGAELNADQQDKLSRKQDVLTGLELLQD